MEHHSRIAGQWLSGTALLCLALAACNKAPQADQPVTGAPIAALQLATAPPPPPTYAPPAGALPPAPRPVAYRPSPQHWRYLTDAYDMSDAFGDTPPDYTVPYDGEDPYVWRADDGAYRVVEWLPDGARYYYYEPGADEPFLIQDPEYSYAYDNGALVAVYTLAGALVADRIAAERAGYAARYYARGHDLYRAAQQDRRRAAYADNWRERAPMVQAQRVRWQQGRQEQPGWQEWNRAHQPQQEARWAPERQRRATYSAALATANRETAMQGRNRKEARRAAENRPAPQPPTETQHRPGTFQHGNRPDIAERHAEADRAQPGLLHGATPPPQAHGTHPAMADHHASDVRQPEPARPQAAQPGSHGPSGPQSRVAARQAVAQDTLAQHREMQQAQQAQHQEAPRAAQAQKHEVQQARQAQHHEAQQAAQAQHAQMQARTQQVQQAQRAAAQAQAQHAQVHTDTHAAPPHVEASRPQPKRAVAPQPQAPHPIPQQQKPGDNGDQHRDRHHH